MPLTSFPLVSYSLTFHLLFCSSSYLILLLYTCLPPISFPFFIFSYSLFLFSYFSSLSYSLTSFLFSYFTYFTFFSNSLTFHLFIVFSYFSSLFLLFFLSHPPPLHILSTFYFFSILHFLLISKSDLTFAIPSSSPPRRLLFLLVFSACLLYTYFPLCFFPFFIFILFQSGLPFAISSPSPALSSIFLSSLYPLHPFSTIFCFIPVLHFYTFSVWCGVCCPSSFPSSSFSPPRPRPRPPLIPQHLTTAQSSNTTASIKKQTHHLLHQ